MKYGLIASRVGHSFSAEIHKELFGYDYELMAIAQEELSSFLQKREFAAVNVTVPYKEAVIEYLDYVDQKASGIGAVNTIVNRDGKLYGYNTDYEGLSALISRESIEIKDKKVLVLGSGGTSKTAYHVVKSLGCSEAYRLSRNGKNGCITYDDAKKCHSDADVLINTTPAGMFPDICESAIDIDSFSNLSAVIDVVYNPLRTKLVTDALNKGIKAVGGLYMLVAQAAFAAERFIGKTVSDERIEEIYRKIFNSKQNIVLIGMPGCGKTTIGKMIAEEKGFDFIDTDEEIYKVYGKSPAVIINECGEKDFRDKESAVIRDICKSQGKVIATGGGAVLRKENRDCLRYNGRVFFLDRDIENIRPTDDRPLSKDRASLEKLYKERYEIYLSSCDVQIKCVDDIKTNVDAVIKEI
jgi:shikimate dehydrogenase